MIHTHTTKFNKRISPDLSKCVTVYQGVYMSTPCITAEDMPSERHLIIESPDMHFSREMQTYIAQEVARPCKQWIHEVLCAQRETERVKLRTEHFVLLPDVDTIPHQVFSRLLLDRTTTDKWEHPTPDPTFRVVAPSKKTYREHASTHPKTITLPTCNHPLQPIERRWRTRKPPNSLHWLAVATDTTLRTLRDLRGRHIPMLISLYTQTCQKIHEEMGIPVDQIMAYVHYPPSVYQLHVHFKHPLIPHISHDSFRIHPLITVINNLEIDSDYYAKSILQLPVYAHTELYTALGLPKLESENLKHAQIQTQACVSFPRDTGEVEKSENDPDTTKWTQANQEMLSCPT